MDRRSEAANESERELVSTPWSTRGPRELLFGRMHEDWTIEARLFPEKSRVFCIASAGCTALALAQLKHTVTAVDVNPAQVAYVEKRLRGAPAEEGTVDRLLSHARGLLPWLGLSERDRSRFLGLDDLEAQTRFWRERLDRRRFRAALGMALSRMALRMFHAAPFTASLPRRFGHVVLKRLARGWATHPNKTNPYAWRLLLGCDPPDGTKPDGDGATLHLLCAEAASYLESCAPSSFDAFTLSNILDGASTDYARRLLLAVRHAATPDARVLIRSFAEPEDSASALLAASDRSLLWGAIRRLDARS